MKSISKIVPFYLLLLFFLASCNSSDISEVVNPIYQCPMDCEHGKTYETSGSCPVCQMDLSQKEEKIAYSETDEISETSIFNLTSDWRTQNNESIKLKDLKGKTLVAVMIYTTCKAACPRLVADIRLIEDKIPENIKNDVKFVFVSIDPETDQPEQLKAFAIENEMNDEQHVFLNGSVDDVREFANVLAVKYKEISPVDFSHSNIISVFNSGGELTHQQEGLGIDNKETVAAIKSAVTQK